MSHLEKSARLARQQLVLNRWLAAFGWSLAIAGGLFIATVAVERSFALLEESGRFYGWLLLGLTGATLAAASIWTLVTREDLRMAAARLDEAAGLKERISTGLFCAASTDPFAQAVVADAEKVVRGMPIRRHLPIRIPGSAPWAGGVSLVALLFFWLFPTLDLVGKQNQREDVRHKTENVARAKAVMQPLVQPNLNKLRENNPALKKDLDELEALKDAKLETPNELRQEMMKKVEQLGKKLEQQANNPELNKVAEFKQMMRQLASQPPSNTPIGELSKDLAKGDLEAAQKAIAAAQEQLAKTAKTPEEQAKAAQMSKDLKNLSEKLEQIAKDDKKVKEQLAKAGLNDKDIKAAMDKLQKKDLEGLKKQLEEKGLNKQQAQQLAQQLQKKCDGGAAAQKLAQALGQAAAAGQQPGGNQQDTSADQGLTDAAQQLSEMESLEQQLNELQASMGQVNSMKNKLGQGCSQCNGSGAVNGQPCPGCSGTGMQPGMGNANEDGLANGGFGGDPVQNAGGIRPKEQTNFSTVKKQAKVQTGSGSIISKQEFEDGQIKGEVSPEFTDAAISAEREAAENVANEKIPRPYQRGISKYFDHLHEDTSKPTPAENNKK